MENYKRDDFLDSLAFPEKDNFLSEDSKTGYFLCPVCTYKEHSKPVALFNHLKEEHKLLIADMHLICDLKKYLSYWHKKFQEESIQAICHTTTIEEKRTKQTLFVLSDKLPEDHDLRQTLQLERLEFILKSQEKERRDRSFSSRCLFCQELYTGNRAELFHHMAKDHNFNVGLPDNLVFTVEFLKLLRQKMDSLQCLFCEKTFRDKVAIREHMRKKQHRKLNPQNKSYDKYYVINYLEMGKGWQAVQAEYDGVISESENDNWDDWKETAGATAVCLFCEHRSSETGHLLQHMKDSHQFNMEQIKTDLGLNFYLQLKLINFIRRRVYQTMCFACHETYPSQDALISHMVNSGHIQQLPDKSEWDQPQYYFPTYENDTLLCCLDDDEDLLVNTQMPVVAEDATVDIENSVLKDIGIRSSLSTA